MAIENVELMHKCSIKHLHIGILKLKYDKETDAEKN